MTIDQVLQWHYPMPLSPSFCVCLAHYPCATIAAMTCDKSIGYDHTQHSQVLTDAHNRWRQLPKSKRNGNAPHMDWCYDCNLWHLIEPAAADA